MLTRSDLHEYQTRAVDFIKSRKRCMLLANELYASRAAALKAREEGEASQNESEAG